MNNQANAAISGMTEAYAHPEMIQDDLLALRARWKAGLLNEPVEAFKEGISVSLHPVLFLTAGSNMHETYGTSISAAAFRSIGCRPSPSVHRENGPWRHILVNV